MGKPYKWLFAVGVTIRTSTLIGRIIWEVRPELLIELGNLMLLQSLELCLLIVKKPLNVSQLTFLN